MRGRPRIGSFETGGAEGDSDKGLLSPANFEPD
jgi:hypothetical protein